MKTFTICLLIFLFIYNVFLSALKLQSSKNKIPGTVDDVFDKEEYEKWKKYNKDKVISTLIFSVISFLAGICFILFDVYSLIANKIVSNPYLQAYGVLGLYLFVEAVIGICENYINKLIIEEKYGFNKLTKKKFIADVIKENVLLFVIFFGLLSLFIAIHLACQDWIILVFSIILVILLFAIMFLFPLLSKIFNKFEPLEEGELRTKLFKLLNDQGFHIKNILVMKASEKTTKSNAYFTGIGKSKVIVLYDNLINLCTPDEIVAAFAHELGHGINHDVKKQSLFNLLSIVLLVLMLYLLVKFPDFYSFFGFNTINYGFALIITMTVVIPLVFPFINIISNWYSRKCEKRADLHAVKEGYGEALISSLKKLAKDNLVDLAPAKILVALTYDHPTMAKRISYIEEALNNQK